MKVDRLIMSFRRRTRDLFHIIEDLLEFTIEVVADGAAKHETVKVRKSKDVRME